MKYLFRALDALLLFAAADCVWLLSELKCNILILPVAVIFLFINIFPNPTNFKIKSLRLQICADGSDFLIAFFAASVMSVVYHGIIWFMLMPQNWIIFTVSALIAAAMLSVVFWNGIVRVYCTSLQLGIKLRIIGIVCGFIPVLNIMALVFIISVVSKEIAFEYKKQMLNENRKQEQICKTKYPILLVHGVFFRDSEKLNYWGRIPEELSKNGASIYYGNHQSALSIKDSAEELAKRIKEIVSETGCEKVNIIAHSKGGLDCRYAISFCGIEDMTASLTTINTPHRGCLFAEYLLKKVPANIQRKIETTYNSAFKKLGDESPDFMTSVYDLTAEKCKSFNEQVHDKAGVYYQSVGSKLNSAVNGKFPLNFSYNFVKRFDGVNDGLVSENSFPWGEKYTLITVKGKRGVSHADMIDLNRENIPEFDVREFYVNLVYELKKKGL